MLTEYDQQGSHCSSPGSDHALATHRRRWGFEQLRDVRGPTRQETPARIAGEARFFRPPTATLFLLGSAEAWSGQRAALQQRASTGSHTDCGARAAVALPAPALSTNFTNSSTLGPRGKAKGPATALLLGRLLRWQEASARSVEQRLDPCDQAKSAKTKLRASAQAPSSGSAFV